MARKTLMVLASLTLTASVLAGCGATGMTGVTPMGDAKAKAQSTDTQRKVPPVVELLSAEAFAALEQLDAADVQLDLFGFRVREARRVASNTLYRYDELLRDWKSTNSDREKDRIEERMLTELTRGLNDVQRAVSSGNGLKAREVYDIANRALDRYEDLRRDWQRAYSDRERREIVNDMLVVLTRALKDIQRI